MHAELATAREKAELAVRHHMRESLVEAERERWPQRPSSMPSWPGALGYVNTEGALGTLSARSTSTNSIRKLEVVPPLLDVDAETVDEPELLGALTFKNRFTVLRRGFHKGDPGFELGGRLALAPQYDAFAPVLDYAERWAVPPLECESAGHAGHAFQGEVRDFRGSLCVLGAPFCGVQPCNFPLADHFITRLGGLRGCGPVMELLHPRTGKLVCEGGGKMQLTVLTARLENSNEKTRGSFTFTGHKNRYQVLCVSGTALGVGGATVVVTKKEAALPAQKKAKKKESSGGGSSRGTAVAGAGAALAAAAQVAAVEITIDLNVGDVCIAPPGWSMEYTCPPDICLLSLCVWDKKTTGDSCMFSYKVEEEE